MKSRSTKRTKKTFRVKPKKKTKKAKRLATWTEVLMNRPDVVREIYVVVQDYVYEQMRMLARRGFMYP